MRINQLAQSQIIFRYGHDGKGRIEKYAGLVEDREEKGDSRPNGLSFCSLRSERAAGSASQLVLEQYEIQYRPGNHEEDQSGQHDDEAVRFFLFWTVWRELLIADGR